MAFDAHRNFAAGTVVTPPSPPSSGTSLTLTAGQGALMPAAPFNAVVFPFGAQPTTSNAEIVRVTAISTDTVTIIRQQEDTSARTILAGDSFSAAITAKTLTDVEAGNPQPLTQVFHAKAYGVTANGKCVTDASITASSSQLSSVSAAFTQADVGKLVAVMGAGPQATSTLGSQIAPPSGSAPTWTLPSGNWVAIGASLKASGGTPTHVQSVSGNSLTANASHQISVSASGVGSGHTLTIIAVLYSATGSGNVSVSDNVGGTWTQVAQENASLLSSGQIVIFESQSNPGGSVTVTVTGPSNTSVTSGACAAILDEWTNVGAVDNVPTGATGTGTTATPPNVSYAANDVVMVAAVGQSAFTASPSSPWTDEGATWFSVNAFKSAYQIPSSAGNTNGTITSLPLATGITQALPGGAVKVSGGGNSQNFSVNATAQNATSIPIPNQAPLFTFASGSTVAGPATAITGTILSVSSGAATLSVTAATSVSNAICFYATDDTADAQAAITAAGAVRGTVEFPDGFIGLSAPLAINSMVEMRGQSCKVLYGSLAQPKNGLNWPTTAPYLAGTVFWQFTQATDALQLSGVGVSEDLRRFGIVFVGGMNFNTGHGINVTGMSNYNGHPDNGPVDSDWDHLYVFGHDGAHYAVVAQNTELLRVGKLRSWGGGMMHFQQTSTIGFYGNMTAIDCFGFMFNCGTAHGLYIDDQSTALGGGQFDFSVFTRWQQWVSGDAEGFLPHVLGCQKPTIQKFIAFSDTSPIWTNNSGQNGFIFVAPDFETGANATADGASGGVYTASIGAGVPINQY